MSAGLTISGAATGKYVVARALPPEIRDGGRVRIGAGIRLDWMTLEILKFLSNLVHFLPGQGG